MFEPSEAMDSAVKTLSQVIIAQPRFMHGPLCIAAFRQLQMNVRPAPMPGLGNMPACPEPRLLLRGGYVSEGRGDVFLDQQLKEFASVVGDMISDYPERHREDLAFDFFDEIRIALALGHNSPGRQCGVEAPLEATPVSVV